MEIRRMLGLADDWLASDPLDRTPAKEAADRKANNVKTNGSARKFTAGLGNVLAFDNILLLLQIVIG